MDSAWPRTMRPTVAQEKNAITSTEMVRLEPAIETRAIAKSRKGNESTTSISRPSAVSTTPPRKPASRPTTTPTATASTVARTPTTREIRVPYAIRTRTSRPRSSVPSQKRRGERDRDQQQDHRRGHHCDRIAAQPSPSDPQRAPARAGDVVRRRLPAELQPAVGHDNHTWV